MCARDDFESLMYIISYNLVRFINFVENVALNGILNYGLWKTRKMKRKRIQKRKSDF